MVQVPTATSVTVEPDTVQTEVVCELKLTGKPELAFALTVNGALPNTRFASAPKVMVWLACVTWKDRKSGVEGEWVVLRACVGWMVQVATATRVRVEADTGRWEAVCGLSLTGKPELG